MPRTCSVCCHAQRSTIDAALVAGTALRAISQRWRISRSALQRHKSHVANEIRSAAVSREELTIETITGQLEGLQQRLSTIVTACEDQRNYRAAIAGVRELRELILNVADLAGVREPVPPKIVGARFSLFGPPDEGETNEGKTRLQVVAG